MKKILRYFGLCKISELEEIKKRNSELLSDINVLVVQKGEDYLKVKNKWKYEFDCFDVLSFGDLKTGEEIVINITAP